MDSSNFPADIFGSPPLSFSPTKHLGNEASRLSQIQEGRWRPITEYTK
jgi:branched-chain amino acid transport system substrate-binding protein